MHLCKLQKGNVRLKSFFETKEPAASKGSMSDFVFFLSLSLDDVNDSGIPIITI